MRLRVAETSLSQKAHLNPVPQNNPSAAPAAGSASPAAANIQPVPATISVSVTGSRNNAANGQRELFTELTETVLLLPAGAVVRLSATAAPGQLLFLTNKESGREVVCRVVKYKDSPAGGGYAELDFTEAMPGFWGAHFPVDAERPRFPTSAEAFHAASRPAPNSDAPTASQKATPPTVPATEAPAEVSGGLPAKSLILTVEEAGKELLEQPAPKAPTTEEINAEITFLQEQLDALLGGRTPAQADRASEAQQPKPDAAAVTDALLKMLGTARGKSQAAPEASAEPNPASSAGASIVSQLIAAPRVSGQTEADAPGHDSEEELAAPALPQRAAKPLPSRAPFTPPTRAHSLNKILVGGVLAAGILAAGGLFWHFHRAARATAAEMSASARATADAARMTARKPVASTKTAEPVPAAAANPETEKERTPPETANAPIKVSPGELHEEAAAELRKLREKPRKEHASLAAAASRTAVRDTSGSADANSETGVLVPAKVLKAARAVAPPKATREYISGNVMIDAVVDASGHVGAMKILSGPEVLHKAAEKALKQYEYQPATLNGKPVASHVKERIQFWYEP